MAKANPLYLFDSKGNPVMPMFMNSAITKGRGQGMKHVGYPESRKGHGSPMFKNTDKGIGHGATGNSDRRRSAIDSNLRDAEAAKNPHKVNILQGWNERFKDELKKEGSI